MKLAVTAVLSLALIFTFVIGVQAAEKELKGNITCAKCELKEKGLKKCATVIVVKEEGKDVVYYFDPAADKKHHGKICTTPTEGTVKGEVSEKNGKKIVKVSKVEWKE